MTTAVVRLRSSDDQVFEVDAAAAKISSLVANVLNDGAGEDNDDDNEIPLPLVRADILRKVVEFCEHYEADPMEEITTPLRSSDMSDLVQEWYAEYIDPLKHDLRVLFDLLLAANFMEVGPLLELGCAAVASLMRGRTAEEIRLTFNITNDLTEEETQEIIKKNVWTEEP
eukprot:CAMPEP_0194282918 /NCGR_PEP_ID=MMETSP0169-20130528/24249_1 /TAXON_ID=218684 /ORGANISM="Corethron pennatum, Strain L29A3" /LENGTH=169 /DNA_ID=CAMNT_0039028385 /DNA_START=14 /DNA_END=523 /DNA_ORIENTATION=-